MGSWLRWAHRADRRLFDAVAGLDSPLLDATLPRLTRAADHSVLWAVTAAVLAAVPSRRSRRAARRGMLSLAASSLLVNVVGKQLAPRPRPDLASVPPQRVARRVPTSNSFPSGHSASAAAFAVGVAVEAPVLAVPVGLAAAAVAFSRVWTGVHYPGDVLAGVAIGAGIAGLGARLVPPEPEPEPPTGPTREQLQPRRLGSGVHVVVNPRSGVAGPAQVTPARLRRFLPAAEIVVLGEHDDLVGVLRAHADRAEVLGVVGGDGSVNAAAAVALERGLPLLVLPGGTLNHFARYLGLDGVADAVRAVTRGTAARVDVGEVDGQIFLNTASLGSYPSFVAERERWQRRLGKPIAAVIATHRVLYRERALPARVDGRPRELAALFVGCGRYEPAGFVPTRRPRLDSGVLDVRYLDLVGRSWRLTTFLQLLVRRDEHAAAFGYSQEQRLLLHLGGATQLARDGEVGPVVGPDLEFRLRPRALTVYRPWPG